MKEKYIKPLSELEVFNALDVVTTSDTAPVDPDTDIPWGS